MAERPGIMVYFSILPGLMDYTDEEVGQLFRAMLDYGSAGVVPQFTDRGLRTLWNIVQPQLDEDAARYQDKVLQRQRAGQASAAKRATSVNGRQRSSTSVNGRQQIQPVQSNSNSIQSNILYSPDGASDSVTQALHGIPNGNQDSELAGDEVEILGRQQELIDTGVEQTPPVENIESSKPTRFVPPSVEEVRAYCIERQNNVDAQAFVDHYESVGWMRGKTKIKDWQACVRTWEKRSQQNTAPVNQRQSMEAEARRRAAESAARLREAQEHAV